MESSVSVSTCLWFDDQAEEAVNFYCSLFPDTKITQVNRHHNPDGTEGNAFILAFELQGQKYTAMNGGPRYKLTEAVSIQVSVETQSEIDRLWTALSDRGKELMCGWVTDRFGLSWQILPRQLPQLLGNKNRAAAERAMQAMMGMVKFDIAALETAAKG